MHKSTIKILLVDDVEANLLALEQLVEAPGRELMQASSGEEALEILLKEQDFAVILMDVQLPGLDGFEVVNLLKAKDNCSDIPIIFLTAFDKEGAMEVQAYASGAVDYVMKPIQPQILISKVDVFVELYRSRQKLMRNNVRLEAANTKLTMEISLREGVEAQLRLADQAIHDTQESIVITDAAGTIRRVNPAFCRMGGFAADELIGHDIVAFAASTGDAPIHELLLSVLQEEGEWQGELHCRHKTHADYTAWAHISGIYNKHQVLTHYCAMLSEINDAQKSELALRKVKLRLEQTQQLSHIGGWEWEHSGPDTYVSNELFHILGTSPDVATLDIAYCRQHVHLDDQIQLDQIIDSLRNGQPTDTILRLILPDGSERTVHEQTTVYTNRRGDILQLIGTLHDITEQSKLEDSFMQAQKMEAVGAMVGGMAHEFNNILAGMNGHVYIAREKVRDNPVVADHLDKLGTLAMRASETIHQMLTFAHKGDIEMKRLPLNMLVKETLKLHKTSVPEHIILSHDVCDENLIVQGDATLLQQLMLNLIINARDAMDASIAPEISVYLQPYRADTEFLKKHTDAKAGVYAQLRVKDNGCGMDAAKLKKIFDPFFTTKGDKGTGLGLSMVYGAVQSHHGIIHVASEAGAGTVFNIYLPLLNQNESNEEIDLSPDGLIEGNGETILVVDDEQIVREMVSDTLEMLGYQVMSACNGKEAVSLFSDGNHKIDLIVLDIVMPKMGGVDAAAAILKIQPDTKVILMTGYNDGNVADIGVQNLDVIEKPFAIEDFSRLIAQKIHA